MERDELMIMIARNIEAIIARKGLSRAEVNRRAKLNQTGINDILKGKSQHPRLDTLHKIAVLGLEVPIAALFAEPIDDEVDQELQEVLGMMPAEERRRFLRAAQAFSEKPSDAISQPASEPGEAAEPSVRG